MAFDLFYLDCRDLISRVLRNRRACLERGRLRTGVPGAPPGGRGPGDVEAGGQRGYEGYVAKAEASAYEQGPRRRWLKVKVPGWTVDGAGWRRWISASSSPRS